MGQIRGKKAKVSACNIRSLSSFGIPYAGMHILVSTDNSAMEDGQGNFDAYVVGDGRTAAEDLPLLPTNDVYDISALHSGATYVDLAAALGTNGANVPAGVRRGGMSVKFIQSSDNKYVQYRLTNQNWSIDVNDWTSDSGDGVFDISAAHSGATYDNLAAALGTNGANVHASKRNGGMSVKFIQNIYATYSVVKTEGLDTEPTGTEIQSASAVTDGVYTAAQLSDLNTAATLPATVGNSVTYYFAVSTTETVDEEEITTTTYTKWVVTKATDDSGEYVQYRYIGTSVANADFVKIGSWQSSFFVRFDVEQSLDEENKNKARKNIGIDSTKNFVESVLNDNNAIQSIPDVIDGGYYYVLSNSSAIIAISPTSASVCKTTMPIHVKKGDIIRVVSGLTAGRPIIAFTDKATITVGDVCTIAAYSEGYTFKEYSAVSTKDQYVIATVSGSVIPNTFRINIESTRSVRLDNIDSLCNNITTPSYYGVRNAGSLSALGSSFGEKTDCTIELYFRIEEAAQSTSYRIYGASNKLLDIVYTLAAERNRLNIKYNAGTYKEYITYAKVGDWLHVVCVCDYTNRQKKLYVNGTHIGTDTGNTFNVLYDYMSGLHTLSIRRVFGAVLTQTEVSALYNNGYPIDYSLPDTLLSKIISNCQPNGISVNGWKDNATGNVITLNDGFILTTTYNSVFKELSEVKNDIRTLNATAEKVESVFCNVCYPQFIPTALPHGNHDCTVIGDDYVSGHYEKSGQVGVMGWSAFYFRNLETFANVKTVYATFLEPNSEWKILQLKSLDYKWGKLITASGRAKDSDESSYEDQGSYVYVFYDVENWGENTRQTPLTFSNCGDYKIIDVSELGVKTYGFWASRDDSVYVSCNFWRDIYLIRLGKGTNNLGKGTYAQADTDKYNGTYAIVNHWHQDEDFMQENEPRAAHGGQFYKGNLYLADNDIKCCRIHKCILRNNGELKFDVIYLNEYNPVSNPSANMQYLYQYIDGLCFAENKMYAQPLIYNTGAVSGSVLVVDFP